METKKKRNFGDIWNAIYIPLLGLAMTFTLSVIGYKTLQGQSIPTELNPFMVGGIALAVIGSALAAAIAIVSRLKQQASE